MATTFIDDFFLSDITNPLSPPAKGLKRKRGRNVTNFNIASPSAKKARLDPAYKKIKEIAHTDSIPFSTLLGYLGSRYYCTYYNSPVLPKLYELFKAIANGHNPMENKVFSIEKSQHIKDTMELGQRSYDFLRAELLPHIKLTSRSKLQSHTIGNCSDHQLLLSSNDVIRY